MAKRGVPEHPKTLRLARRLGIEPWAAVGLLECLWHWCSKYAVTGEITADPIDIAEGIRYSGDAHALIDGLVDSGWLEITARGTLGIHDVSEHADNTWRAAIARAGLQFWDAVTTKSPIPDKPITTKSPQRQDEVTTKSLRRKDVVEPASLQNHDCVTTESQQNHNSVTTPSQLNHHSPSLNPLPEPNPEPPYKSPPSRDVEQDWDEFLRIYPPRSGDRKLKLGKEKFRRRIRLGTSAEAILDGAKRYRAWCDSVGYTGTELVQQLTTWFNGEAWREPFDLPEPVPKGSQPKRLEPVKDMDYYFGDSEPVEDSGGEIRYRMKAFWIRDGIRTDEPFEPADWYEEHGLTDLRAVVI